MSDDIAVLSEREKETLRLLLSGHDAKSIARSLGLSVHTINERLRDSRRKLRVASSREAARLLAAAERNDPDSLVDKQLGVVEARADTTAGEHTDRNGYGGRALFWLGGGMLIMSLIIAAVMISPILVGSSASPAMPTSSAISAMSVPDAVPSPATIAAGSWVVLLDQEHWDQSWDAAGSLFKSQLPKARWAPTIQTVRRPLGPISSRTVQSATSTTSLPGVPPGRYEIVQFNTDFAQKRGAIETVVLAREGPQWKVNGYFIR